MTRGLRLGVSPVQSNGSIGSCKLVRPSHAGDFAMVSNCFDAVFWALPVSLVCLLVTLGLWTIREEEGAERLVVVGGIGVAIVIGIIVMAGLIIARNLANAASSTATAPPNALPRNHVAPDTSSSTFNLPLSVPSGDMILLEPMTSRNAAHDSTSRSSSVSRHPSPESPGQSLRSRQEAPLPKDDDVPYLPTSNEATLTVDDDDEQEVLGVLCPPGLDSAPAPTSKAV